MPPTSGVGIGAGSPGDVVDEQSSDGRCYSSADAAGTAWVIDHLREGPVPWRVKSDPSLIGSDRGSLRRSASSAKTVKARPRAGHIAPRNRHRTAHVSESRVMAIKVWGIRGHEEERQLSVSLPAEASRPLRW